MDLLLDMDGIIWRADYTNTAILPQVKRTLDEEEAQGQKIGVFTSALDVWTTDKLEENLELLDMPYLEIVVPEHLPSYVKAFISLSPFRLALMDRATTVKKPILFDPTGRYPKRVNQFTNVKSWEEVVDAIHKF